MADGASCAAKAAQVSAPSTAPPPTYSLTLISLEVNSGSGSQAQPGRSSIAPELMTKKQRQNAAKRDVQKQAKLDAEAERLAVLAKHKRELERAKMAEQFGSGKGASKA